MPRKHVNTTGMLATGVTSGTYGTSKQIPQITLDVDGRVFGATPIATETITPGIYGDGSDGAGVADGINALAGCGLIGTVYTATRDLFFIDVGAVPALDFTGVGTVLNMSGFRLYVNGTLGLSGIGNIVNNGGDALLGAAGLAAPFGALDGGALGGVGGAPGAGAAGVATTNAYGGAGGASGADGVNAGAAGGTATAPVAGFGTPRTLPSALTGVLLGFVGMVSIMGGAGGAGGGGVAVGGGGGGGAGVLVIAAKWIISTVGNAIRAAGGAGAAGSGASGGGGGGGGGGAVILIYETCTGLTLTAAAHCPGGAPGAGVGTGVIGTVGANGTLIQLIP